MVHRGDNEIVVPHLYLDTNMLLDVISLRRREPSSEELLEKIRTRRWVCSTAHFTLMEAIEAIQEERFIHDKLGNGWTLSEIARRRGERRLPIETLTTLYRRMRDRLRITYPFIRYYYLTGEGWDEAVELCARTNIDPTDCIHLASAKEAGCDLLVTRDEGFRELASEHIPTALPEQVDDNLRNMAFDI